MSHAHPVPSASAFVDGRLLVSGPLDKVALTLHRAGTDGVIVLDDATGRTLDLDLRGLNVAGRGREDLHPRRQAPAKLQLGHRPLALHDFAE